MPDQYVNRIERFLRGRGIDTCRFEQRAKHRAVVVQDFPRRFTGDGSGSPWSGKHPSPISATSSGWSAHTSMRTTAIGPSRRPTGRRSRNGSREPHCGRPEQSSRLEEMLKSKERVRLLTPWLGRRPHATIWPGALSSSP